MFRREKKTEVFVANDSELYTTVRQTLKVAQTPCEVKIVSAGTQNRRTDTPIGRVDERPELEIQYYIYTPREYAERAEYMINEYRKSLSR